MRRVHPVARSRSGKEAYVASSAALRLQVARLWRWSGTREGIGCVSLFVLALVPRLLLAPYHGFFGDLDIYANWGHDLERHFWDFYSFDAHGSYVIFTSGPERGWTSDMPANYPPLGIYLFWAQMRLSVLAASLTGHQLTASGSLTPLGAVFMKTVAFAADLGTGVLGYVIARREHGVRWALIIAGAYLFSPMVLLDGALWGQTDGVISFLVLLALLCAVQQRPVWAGILFAAAITFKPQPLIFFPLLAIYTLRHAGWRPVLRLCAAVGGATAAICLPFLVPPRPEIMALFANITRFHVNIASPTAYNWWWLSPVRTADPSAPYLGPLSPSVIGWAMFALVTLIALFVIWRDRAPATLFLAAAALALTSFVFTTMQYERYIYPVCLCVLVASAYRPRYLWFSVVVSITAFANTAMVVLILLHRSPWIDGGFWQHFPDPYDWPWSLTVVIAVINIGLLLAVLITCTSVESPLRLSQLPRQRPSLRRQPGTLRMRR